MTVSGAFAATDLCVKCGLCLPHCPTYRLARDESESPRGRLALIQAWAEGRLPVTQALLVHMDSCLACRRCETMCPAKVPYGRLLDDFRAAQAARSDDWRGRLVRRALASRGGRNMLARLVSVGLPRGLAALGLAQAELLDTATPSMALQPSYPASGQEQARVALFVGCTGDWLDVATLQAAIAVLNRLGVRVDVPSGQGCCGALHWHAGDRAAAEPLLTANRAAFRQGGYDAVVSAASGCGAFLKEQGGLDVPLQDINRLLLDLLWPEDAVLQPWPMKVALHTPCTLAVSGDGEAPRRLLQKIPQLQLAVLPSQPGCCGAAGTYGLDHAEIAGRLRDETLVSAQASAPDCLATSNIGCAQHLRAGLTSEGLAVEVLHPVALLARSLGVQS